MAASTTISFVIPLYNHLAETREMLTSLQASLPGSLNYEIILVDDGSSDGTREWLLGLRDARFRVHLNDGNLGYAASNNVGAELARGEILGLLNNDLLFEPGWLTPMLDVLLAPDLAAGLVGNVQYRIADGSLDHAGMHLAPEAQLCHIRALPQTQVLPVRAFVVTGACMLLRKTDFISVGGFDEQFFNGCEDVDLCLKIQSTKKNIYVAPQSRIRHHVSLSRKARTLRDIRNSRRLFSRWRKEMKQELSAVWRGLLATGPDAYAGRLSGDLAADILGTPHTASRIIAEAMLRREEASWARALGETTPNANVAGKVRCCGLRYSRQHGGFMLEKSVEFVIDSMWSARNFFVCGRRIDDLSQPIQLTISANNLQTVSVQIKAEPSLRAGLNNPLLLHGIPNFFRVETNGTVILTHIILDDQVVHL